MFMFEGSVALSWEDVNSAVDYYAVCCNDANLDDVVLDSGWIEVNEFTFEGLDADGEYWFAVRARKNCVLESDWSDAVYFGPAECLGDTNGGGGVPDGKISLSDLTGLISLIRDDGNYSVQLSELSLEDQEKYGAGDCAGGDGNPDGAISLSDVTRLIDFIRDEPGYVKDSCICLDGGVVVTCE